MVSAIGEEDIARYAAVFRGNPQSRLVKSVLSKVQIHNIATDPDVAVQRSFKYHLSPTNIPIKDQESSGRCWIFSFTTMMSRKMIKYYNLLPTFKLSQKYLMFYDHLEKCNALMEVMFFTKLKPNSLEMMYLRDSYTGDGGTWNFFAQLVAKYGVIPYDEYPDNKQSTHSHDVQDFLSQHVFAQGPAIYAAESRAQFNKIKGVALQVCYNILESFLGRPPTSFRWEYPDAKGKIHAAPSKPFTPQMFYQKYVKRLVNVDDYIVLINDPRNPYYKIYSVELLHNVIPTNNGNNGDIKLDRYPTNLYFNVPIDILRQAVYKSLRGKMAVPFAADVSHYMRSKESVMDTANVHYEDMLGISPLKPRKFLYENLLSSMSHAMLFIGCNGPKGDWQVENSWGQENKDFPYLTMTDDWFEHYVGEIAINKRYLSKSILAAYTKLVHKSSEYTYLPFWDTFGALAMDKQNQSGKGGAGKIQQLRSRVF